MFSYRNYLLDTFGIEDEYTAIVNSDIKLQKDDDCEPFGEIVTDKQGKTTLRVGNVLSKGPVVRVR